MGTAISRIFFLWLALGCGNTRQPPHEVAFSKADTITDQFLVLQDSLHHHWLRVAIHEQSHNDHLQALFQTMIIRLALPPAEQEAIRNQIEQLGQIRLNPRNMANPDVIREHDLARQALATDIFQLIAANGLESKDSAINGLALRIQDFQQRTWHVRLLYDSLAQQYNQFLLQHQQILIREDPGTDHQPRPLFQAALKK